MEKLNLRRTKPLQLLKQLDTNGVLFPYPYAAWHQPKSELIPFEFTYDDMIRAIALLHSLDMGEYTILI